METGFYWKLTPWHLTHLRSWRTNAIDCFCTMSINWLSMKSMLYSLPHSRFAHLQHALQKVKKEKNKWHFWDNNVIWIVPHHTKCWKQVGKIVTSYLRIVSFCCGYEGITAEVQVTARVTGQANHLLGKICNIYIMVSKMMFIMLLQKKLLYLWKDQWWTRISKRCLWRKFSNSKEPQQVSSGEENRKQTIDTL